MLCVLRNNVVNEMAIQTCIPGLRRTGLGTAGNPERQADGTWVHRVPFHSDKGSSFETKICSIDLIDFDFSAAAGAAFDVSKVIDPAEYCITKGFSVPRGEVTLSVHTRTKSPKLVIRSSVITAPVAALLQPPPAIVVIPVPPILFIPPPPPPVLPPPAAAPPPPPF
jgi:hypothetical protein